MQAGEQQAVDDRDKVEIENRAEVRLTTHKIAWKRMIGSIDAANPFAEAGSGRADFERADNRTDAFGYR